MMRLMANLTKLLLAGMGLLASAMVHAQDIPAIAAASDLQFALDGIATRFQKDSGRAVRITYGSSGNFTRQIAQDAPFEMFLSADEAYVFQLAAQNLTSDRGVRYASGRIVLFVPHSSSFKPDAQLEDLRKALADGRVKRFAIANPEHAPYGRAAMQALKSAGLWDKMQPHLVLGENVSQAAQFAASGSAQGGIFAYSLALAPAIAARGQYILIPEKLHQPLHQRMVLMRKAGDTARLFYAYLQQPAARAVFKGYGFALPGEFAN
jgi:molybdate transport system substrate-binding protein